MAVLENLLVFGRLLRELGLPVDPGRMIDVAHALQLIDVQNRDDVYHACRTLLVSRAEQLAAFDRAFTAFFLQRGAAGPRLAAPRSAPDPALAAGNQRLGGAADLAASDPADDPPTHTGVWSDAGGIANKDFATFTAEEIALGRAALARLEWQPGERRTRRWVPGRGTRIDLRRAIARSLRTGGEIVSLPRRDRRSRPRTLVVLCDVSGSMERYSRMLLHFVHSLIRRHRHVEVFLFSTRLTRVTRDVQSRRLDVAVSNVSRAVPDWAGGTRIGEALAQFHRRWARRVLHRGPVVLVISDGWDRGEPTVLRDQIARLQRSSHRLIWLNPLIGTVDYAPLTRGLQAALPYVDDFLPARTLNDLGDLAVQLNLLAAGSRRPRASRVRVPA
jgi:uncharacterized protein with von Willebrand factor type A (vWA) domain